MVLLPPLPLHLPGCTFDFKSPSSPSPLFIFWLRTFGQGWVCSERLSRCYKLQQAEALKQSAVSTRHPYPRPPAHPSSTTSRRSSHLCHGANRPLGPQLPKRWGPRQKIKKVKWPHSGVTIEASEERSAENGTDSFETDCKEKKKKQSVPRLANWVSFPSS